MTTPPPSQPQVIADRYELGERIGRGGMAEVWRARDRQTGQQVAVKLLHERFADDPGFVARFRREAQSAAALNHPNVVKVYDYGRSGARYFLVEELIEGTDLQRYLRTHAPLPVAQALTVAAQAAAGVAAAHSTGIVHRDLKPGNLLIRNDGVVKVSNLGLARAVAMSGLTDTNLALGTAAYMSPEQAQGLELRPASDVYSLGVVLYELLTGRPPFEGATPLAVALKQVNEDPPPPSTLRPDLPPDVEALVLRALAKHPEQRFPDAGALRAAITRLPQYDPDALVLPLAAARPAFAAHPSVPPAATAVIAPGANAAETAAAPRRIGPSRGEAITMIAFIAIGLLLGVAAVLAVRSLPRLAPGRVQPMATPPAVIVPNFVGRTVQDARRLAEDQGLNVAVEERADAGATPGTVIDQEPPAGRTARGGSTVRLIVAARPPEVTVPNLQGLTVEDARAMLGRVGLSISRTSERPSTPEARGRVVGQDPPSGAPVQAGSSVELFIGDGSLPPVPPTTTPTATATPRPVSPTPAAASPTPTRPAVATPTATAGTPAPTPTPRPATPTPGGATATPAPATATPSGATPTPSSATATPAAATPTPGGTTATPAPATATPMPAPATTTPPPAAAIATPPAATATQRSRRLEATPTPMPALPPATATATSPPPPPTATPAPAHSPRAPSPAGDSDGRGHGDSRPRR